MGFIFLFLAKLAGTIKTVCAKKCGVEAAGAKSSIKISLIRSFVCVLISSIVFLLDFEYMETIGMGISLFSGLCNAIFLFLWLLAAERVSLCMLEIFCMVGSVVIPLILAPYLYVDEFILWYQWIGVGLLFLSMFFFFEKKIGNENGGRLTWGTFALLLGCAGSSAGTLITQKLYITYSRGNMAGFNFITFFVMALLFLVVSIMLKYNKKQKSENEFGKGLPTKIYILIIIAAVMLYGYQVLSMQAVKYFDSGIFYPLSYAITWPMMFLSDTLIFKEKIGVKKFLGLGIVIFATILICI